MAARLFLLATVFSGQLLAGWSNSEPHFEVHEGEWGTCKRINSSMACYQTRDVYCSSIDSKKAAPWRHCSGDGSRKPENARECLQCQQDCVVTMWSEWTPCSSRDVYTTRNRSVVAPQLEGGLPCPALRERRRCESRATVADLERRHTWRLGTWLQCEPLDGRDCGEGTRARSVECVDLQGRTVNQTLCLQEEAYLRVLPPPLVELCEVPCPCQLSEWSQRSEPAPDCSLSTSGFVSLRSRTVQRHPTLGGQPCGALEDVQDFPGDVECPTVYWEASGWSECSVHDDHPSCGAGYRRRYTYCMEEDMDGVTKQVEPERCNSTERLTNLDPCHIPCPQQCRISEWTAWSHCPNDTCETMLSYRNRTVLVEPYGYECPHLAEVRECPAIPCARWVPDEWSTCFPSSSFNCGWGTESRNVFCRDPDGNLASTLQCNPADLPNQVAVCYKHCLNDTCVISDWREWSACSESCGNTPGVQTRSRYVAVNTSGSCFHLEGGLSQQQSCSVDTLCEFPVFHIEYGHWGECLVPANATRDDKMCSGVRTRTATCFRDGEEVPDNACVIGSRLLEEPCSVPCSTNCTMSEWLTFSECSATCIETSRRRLLEFGTGCPSVDSSGFEIQTSDCDCGKEYDWVAADTWSSCQAFPTPLSLLYVNSAIPDAGALCGQGSQSRIIECRDDLGTVVDERLCDMRTKPPSVRSCVVRCSKRCVITNWTDYSLCSESTMMQRTRQILPFSGYENYIENCPELFSVAQVDEQTCPSHDFSRFTWTIVHDFEELHSCYLPADKVCGPGIRNRTISCINPSVPGTAVNAEFCSRQSSPPDTSQICNENCNIDCEYAHPGWSVWSPCSVTCGTGIQTRTRTVQRNPRGEGRHCGHLNETTTCEMPPCEFFKYSYTDRSVCRPLNETMGCGEGISTSDLVCLVNGVAQFNTSACEPSLGLKAPQRIFTCSVPCDSECVWSEWSTLQWCPDCRSGCYKRTRHILRFGEDCEGTTEQFRPCPMDEAFWWTGDWTDCIVQGAPQEYCGAGIQRRKVECQQGNKGGTYDKVCSHLVKPETSRGCSVPCPVDCVVDTFSEWSSCGECSSDLRATATRKRRVLVMPKNGGRSRPHLVEERACPNLGCDEYFIETNSSALDCTAERTDGVCGLVAHDVLLCRKNTKYVKLEECLQANASGKIVHNANLLHRHADVYCNIECPVVEECNFTEFGPWSECLHICDWSPEDKFQYRTRTLLTSWEGRQELCHSQQQEVRVCPSTDGPTSETRTPPEDERCIRFEWLASNWYSNNTRDVKCHGRGWNVEDSACIESLHPVTSRNSDFNGFCNCPFLSECNGVTTECVCENGFEMVGSLCLPFEGCINNSELMEMSQQCLLHEECNASGECVCPEGIDCPTVTVTGVEPDPKKEETSTQLPGECLSYESYMWSYNIPCNMYHIGPSSSFSMYSVHVVCVVSVCGDNSIPCSSTSVSYISDTIFLRPSFTLPLYAS